MHSSVNPEAIIKIGEMTMVKKFIESYGLVIICMLAAVVYVSVADAAMLCGCM